MLIGLTCTSDNPQPLKTNIPGQLARTDNPQLQHGDFCSPFPLPQSWRRLAAGQLTEVCRAGEVSEDEEGSSYDDPHQLSAPIDGFFLTENKVLPS